MNTRSAILVGSLALGIGVTAILVQIPHAATVFPAEKESARKTSTVPVRTEAAASRVSTFYGENVRSDLFARPLPPEPASAPSHTEVTSSAPPPPPTVAPPPPDVFGEVVYTGTVTMEGEKQALLENSRTKAGWYLHKGDTFMGATVTQIEDDGVTLRLNGQTRRISKSTAYNLTPFNTQAGAPTNGNPADRRAPGVAQTNTAGIAIDTQTTYHSVLPSMQLDMSDSVITGFAPAAGVTFESATIDFQRDSRN